MEAEHLVALAAVVAIILVIRTSYIVLGREKLNLDEFRVFMRVRKRWWLGPILTMLVFLGLLVIFTQPWAMAPFIYELL